MADSLVGRVNGAPCEQRIIGIELRHVDGCGAVEEVALVPCDVRLPLSSHAYGACQLSMTVHTSHGDIAVPNVSLRT